MSEDIARDRYLKYREGWNAGALMKQFCDLAVDVSDIDFQHGYRNGQTARRSFLGAFAVEVGYSPTIVRTA